MVQEIDAGLVLIVEYIVPPPPAITRVVPSVAIALRFNVPIAVLLVHVVPFVEVDTLPPLPTETQAFIEGNHLMILGVEVTVIDDMVSPGFTHVFILLFPKLVKKNLPFSYVIVLNVEVVASSVESAISVYVFAIKGFATSTLLVFVLYT